MNGTFSFFLLSCLVLLFQTNGAPFDAPFPEVDESPVALTSHETHPQYEALSKTPQIDFIIHESCNVIQSETLHRAFSELRGVATMANDYLESHGFQDPLILKYFGKGSDKSIPFATFMKIAKGDKTDLIFRCDDPDGKCALNADWNGHWRGEKAKDETVICDLSFKSRLWLDKICSARVFNINTYWAIDLLHRSLHLPAIGQNLLESADSYQEILQLAKKNPKEAVKNAHTLQTFAFEVASRSRKHPQGCMAQMKL